MPVDIGEYFMHRFLFQVIVKRRLFANFLKSHNLFLFSCLFGSAVILDQALHGILHDRADGDAQRLGCLLEDIFLT